MVPGPGSNGSERSTPFQSLVSTWRRPPATDQWMPAPLARLWEGSSFTSSTAAGAGRGFSTGTGDCLTPVNAPRSKKTGGTAEFNGPTASLWQPEVAGFDHRVAWLAIKPSTDGRNRVIEEVARGKSAPVPFRLVVPFRPVFPARSTRCQDGRPPSFPIRSCIRRWGFIHLG